MHWTNICQFSFFFIKDQILLVIEYTVNGKYRHIHLINNQYATGFFERIRSML